MQDTLNILIQQNSDHQKRWDELIAFLSEGRGHAQINNSNEAEDAYRKTINKVLELFKE